MEKDDAPVLRFQTWTVLQSMRDTESHANGQ